MWVVIGMGLLRDRSIVSCVDQLGLAISTREGQPVVAPSAIAQARARLGEEPMKWLFERVGRHWGHESASRDRWHGLAVYGADGTKLAAADTPENAEEFGRHAEGAFPALRVVALMALRSRLLVEVQFGSYSKHSEVALARPLWSELPDHSLAIVDRGFLAAPVLVPIAAAGTERHWLTRANSNTRYDVVEQLREGDAIVDMTVDARTRALYPDLPQKWRMRAVRYQRPGHEPQTLLTSMLDPARYPAAELAALYHERWELELMFDEIKTHQLRAQSVLRSQQPSRVRQEIWGILLAYNLVRREIERIAARANLPPRRISFLAALHLVCEEWAWASAPRAKGGTLGRDLANLEAKIKRFILPERRPDRSFPRAVKVARSRYPSRAVLARQEARDAN